MSAYEAAREAYAKLGVDTELALQTALDTPISVHCWQADDVRGFESAAGSDSGGIMATGGFPGKARGPEEVRADLAQVLQLVPGTHRVNLHACYAETAGKAVNRDELDVTHFTGWMDWAEVHGVALDFNPTYFAHPMADSGFTLSSADPAIRDFWVRHGIACRHVASAMAQRQGSECVLNHWVPDGAKDHPADRWSPRARLAESLDRILEAPMPGCSDAVESKLFGLGSEDYVVGSFEFYSSYALQKGVMFCLDMGHFHPTESVADKLSGLLPFHKRVLLHTSRPIRWDSDHVVLFNDDLRAVFTELVRGRALARAVLALDFFDASINRVAAYVIGVRATRKALLWALLDPTAMLQGLEAQGKGAQKLAWMEELKTMPFGAVWDELCARGSVPVGAEWIPVVEEYERKVLSQR